jgi:hypothetical protein
MLLATKLVLVPLLIAAITVAGQRLGPRTAGALTGLPVVAGPVAFFLAIEQGAPFAARAAVATLAGEASLAAFCVLYAVAALHAPWLPSVTIGWLGFALGTLLLQSVAIPPAAALALALATPVAIRALTPRPALPLRPGRVSHAEMALRMTAGAILVIALTGIADLLGPRLSGLLTVFPIATTVLAVFSHRSLGAPFAVHLLRGLALGLYSLTAFFLALALLLERAGVAPAFVVAVIAALAVQWAVLRASSPPALHELRARTQDSRGG